MKPSDSSKIASKVTTDEQTQETKMRMVRYTEQIESAIDRSMATALTGDYHTLSQFAKTRGQGIVIGWLSFCIVQLSEFCGCRDKMTTRQTKECARLIATHYYMLKTSEMVLFFRKVRLGEYGHFYGAVDPQRILCALKEFCEWRNVMLEHYESEKQAEAFRQEKQRVEESWKGYEGGLSAYLELRGKGYDHDRAMSELRRVEL